MQECEQIGGSEACEAAQVPMAEAALRWLLHHSHLEGGRGDGLILGASTLGQLEANMAAAQAGPLPEGVTAAWEAAWEVARVAAPAYATVLKPAPYEAVGWETRWKEVDDAMSISTRL